MASQTTVHSIFRLLGSALITATLGVASGCDASGKQNTSQPSAVRTHASAAANGTASAAANGTASAAANGTASAAANGTASAASSAMAAVSPWAGHYEGTYVAERGTVNVPKGVTYKTWQKDEGLAHVGEGKMAIDIDSAGNVTGKSSGPLGELKLRGRIEKHGKGHSLRAGVTPVDPQGRPAMRGVLTSVNEATPKKSNELRVQMRLVSHDGAIIRVAKMTLR